MVPLGLGFPAQLRACTCDREPVFIKQLLDPHHRFHVAPAIHTLPGAAFNGLELRKFGLPEPKDVGWKTAQAGDFADAEIELVRDNNFDVAGRFLRRFLAKAHGCHFRISVSSTSTRRATTPKSTDRPRKAL